VSIKVLSFTTPENLCWSFDALEPYFRVPSGSYTRSVKVDSFPAYAHDLALVESEARRVDALFPITQEVSLCVIDREFLDRTNGWCNVDYLWEGREISIPDFKATIVLSGKRIPIHPAMTRYLVAHEYGHAVRAFISRERKEPSDALYKPESLYGEYQRLRGMEQPKHYGGGTWHSSVEELFANDFRILVLEAEREFWPHPGFARPEECPAVVDFWRNAREGKFQGSNV